MGLCLFTGKFHKSMEGDSCGHIFVVSYELIWLFWVSLSQAGRSRSATIVTAYLMKRHGLSFSKAYEKLKTIKQDVQ